MTDDVSVGPEVGTGTMADGHATAEEVVEEDGQIFEFGLEHGIDPDIYAKRWWSLSVLNLSLLIIMIGNTALNVAIPILSEELGSTNSQLQWMIDAYSLVFAGLLFTAGNFGDRYGRKGILQLGLVVFGAATAYAAFFAKTSGDLIGARLVMGAGAAMVMPATLSIVTNIFPTHERAKAVAIWAGIAGGGSALGPLASGFVLEHWGWSSVFLVNVPFIVLALVLGVVLVPKSKGGGGNSLEIPATLASVAGIGVLAWMLLAGRNQGWSAVVVVAIVALGAAALVAGVVMFWKAQRLGGIPLDIPGAVLSSAGLALVIYALIEAPSNGWLSGHTVLIGSAGVVSLALFVAHELRVAHPMLDVRLFRIGSFGTSSLILTMVFFALMGTFFSLTQLLQLVWGYTPLEAAVRLLPISFFMVLTAPQSARLAEKFGKSRVVGAGMAMVAIGILVLSRTGTTADYWLLVIGASIMSSGMGLAMSPTTDLLMSSVPRRNAGMGSAMNDTTRELGGSIGVALFGSLLASKYVHGLGDMVQTIPEQYRDVVTGSLGGAMGVAQGARKEGMLPADVVDRFVSQAQEAWVGGLRMSLVIASVIVLTAAAVAFFFLPNKAADVEELEEAHVL